MPMQGDVLHHRDLMVSGHIDRAIFHLGAPAALAALLQAGFLVVDAFWLGRVGPVAVAAASTAGFMMWLAQTIGEGLASGSASLLAQAVGAARRDDAARSAAAGLALALWSSVLVLIAGLWLSRPTFAFMATSADVTADGLAYIRIILFGMPAYFVFAWISASFRALGDARTPLRLLGMAAAVNLLADPVLIFGFGPLPALGVSGAAIATVGSWVVAALWGWRLLGSLELKPRLSSLVRPPRETWRALGVGLPLGVEGALFSLIYILLTRIITDFGTPAVAALGVGHKLEVLNYFVCVGMGAAATTLVGQNLGNGDARRAARCGWRCLFLTIVPVGAITTVLVLFPRHAVAVFIADEAVVSVGATYVLMVGMTQAFMAAEVVLLGAFAGAQWTPVPAGVEIGFTAARIPLAWFMVAQGYGIEGVWFAIAATTVVKGILIGILYAWKMPSGSAA